MLLLLRRTLLLLLLLLLSLISCNHIRFTPTLLVFAPRENPFLTHISKTQHTKESEGKEYQIKEMSSKESESKSEDLRTAEQAKVDVTKPIPTLCMSTADSKCDFHVRFRSRIRSLTNLSIEFFCILHNTNRTLTMYRLSPSCFHITNLSIDSLLILLRNTGHALSQKKVGRERCVDQDEVLWSMSLGFTSCSESQSHIW